jgi:hypothetical protein
MPESLSHAYLLMRGTSAQNREVHPDLEHELLLFIRAVDKLILASSSTHFLTELWLEEFARLDPGQHTTSTPDWRSVSLAASKRLLKVMLDLGLQDDRGLSMGDTEA